MNARQIIESSIIVEEVGLTFDNSKLWFHGSGAKFNKFRAGKDHKGVNEMGTGIYLTDRWSTANAWAGKGGYVYACHLRKGPIWDFQARPTLEDAKRFHEAHTRHMDSLYGPGSAYTFEDFLKDTLKVMHPRDLAQGYGPPLFQHTPRASANWLLKLAGYVGAQDRNTQIRGQIIVFDPKDVKIVERQDGGGFMDRNDDGSLRAA